MCAALLLLAGGLAGQTPSPDGARIAMRGDVTALVGGTLIDGHGGPPIRNSVILVTGERITRVGTVGSVPIPADAKIISTEGMSVLPGLWDMHVHLMINGHSDYAHWDRTYLPMLERVIMPASARQLLLAGVTSARDLGAPLGRASRCAMRSTPAVSPDRRCTSPAPFCSTARIRGRRPFAGE